MHEHDTTAPPDELHEHRSPSHHHHVHFDSPDMASYAELEAETLMDLLTSASTMLAEQCRRHDVEVRRVLDLGCGPGVGSCALAERFPSARVLAADGSASMLERAAARAERLGLTERVETRQVELPADFATLEHADVVWASMVLHHLGDEREALRRLRDLLGAGGMLAIVEREAPIRLLTHDADLGRPGLWARLDAAWAVWFADMRSDLAGAITSTDYPAMLAAAGFELVVDEVLTVVLDPPLDDRARRFASHHVGRMRVQLADHADPDDLAALDTLVDKEHAGGVLLPEDAGLRASRHLYVARPR
jgi:SAM-dependent methyltransferase